jgi:IS4 transposase
VIQSPIFDQFVNHSPLSVMSRAMIERVFSASSLDALFDRVADAGYTRELLFSTVVDLMSRVVFRKAPHVQSAYQQRAEQIPVTLKSVYEKLQNIEPVVSAELVRHVTGRCYDVIAEMGGTRKPLLAGRRVRILDGNHLAATQKRLQVTRGHTAGPLPGQALAILDPQAMVIADLIPCEDAHTQERALLGQVLAKVDIGEVWVGDRNFCTTEFLCELEQKEAFFVIRRHGNTTTEAEPGVDWGAEVETETGWVRERRVWLCVGGLRVLEVRCVRVRLRRPTEDGDVEIEVLTNLPVEEADAAAIANLYRNRWTIEGAFHELTMSLRCEVETLGYPKAALFGFAVAVSAYNVLSVLKAALRVAHGEEKVANEVSSYYLVLELSAVYAGMMIALPAPLWSGFGSMPVAEFAGHLRRWATQVNMERIRKSPRKPTKNPTPRIQDPGPHVATARLLDDAKKNKKSAKK